MSEMENGLSDLNRELSGTVPKNQFRNGIFRK
jgi:hypothetical protein